MNATSCSAGRCGVRSTGLGLVSRETLQSPSSTGCSALDATGGLWLLEWRERQTEWYIHLLCMSSTSLVPRLLAPYIILFLRIVWERDYIYRLWYCTNCSGNWVWKTVVRNLIVCVTHCLRHCSKDSKIAKRTKKTFLYGLTSGVHAGCEEPRGKSPHPRYVLPAHGGRPPSFLPGTRSGENHPHWSQHGRKDGHAHGSQPPWDRREVGSSRCGSVHGPRHWRVGGHRQSLEAVGSEPAEG